MKNTLLVIIFFIPFLATTQSSNDVDFVDIMVASVVSSSKELSGIINLEPYSAKEDKIYYNLVDADLILIKDIKDGSATFKMPFNEDYLKRILEEFVSKGFELELAENNIYASNSRLFFSLTKMDDIMIFFGMEKSRLPK